MPRKKKGGGGPPLIPIDSGGKKKKASPPAPALPPDLALPEKLAGANVTARSLRNGAYQRKLLAFFAPYLLPEFFNSIRRNLHISDAQTQKLAAEIFGLTQTGKGGVNILVNQNNQNNAKAESASVSRTGQPTTPDEMFRMLSEEREQRKQVRTRDIEFLPTPDAGYVAKITEGGGN